MNSDFRWWRSCRAAVLFQFTLLAFTSAVRVSGAQTPPRQSFVTPAALLNYSMTLHPGANFIANQLDNGSNTLNEVLPSMPPGTTLSPWNAAQQGFSEAAIFFPGSGWMPDLVLPPGQGAVIFTVGQINPVTFSGTQPVSQLPVVLGNGVYLLGSQTNALGRYEIIIGAAPADGTILYRFDPILQAYMDSYSFVDGVGWFPSEPAAEVGESVFILPPGAGLTPGPGTVLLANLGPGWAAPVFDPGGAPLAGSTFRAQLYAGVSGSPAGSLIAVGLPVSFLEGSMAGLFHGGPLGVPFASAGDTVTVQVRAWPSAWATYEEAGASGAAVGESGLVSVVTGGDYLPAASMAELRSFSLQLSPPVILTQPSAITQADLGSNVVLTASAGGAVPLLYQWFRGTCPAGEFSLVPGGTSPILTLDDLQPSDAGYYYLEVMNPVGAAYSATNELVLNLGGSILAPLTLQPGFTAVAYPLHFLNNTLNDIFPTVPFGSTFLKWDPVGQTFLDAVTYIDESVGWIDSNFDPVGDIVTLLPGEGAFLNNAGGTAEQLQFHGVIRAPKLPVTLAQAFTFLSAQLPFPSTYEEITGRPPVEGTTLDRFDSINQNFQTFHFLSGEWNDGDQVVPEPVIDPRQGVFVSFQQPVSITDHPTDQLNVVPGGNVTFSVGVAVNQAPVRYQWRRNGVNIPGATNSTYTILGAGQTDAGHYKAVVQTGPENMAFAGDPIKEVLLNNAMSSNPARLRFNTPRPAFSPIPGAPFMITGAGNRIQGFEPAGLSAFFIWTAPGDGIVTFDTLGSSFDTVLTGLTGNMVEIVRDDDGGPFLTSRIAFNVTNNAAYLIQVDPRTGASTDLVLGWFFEPTQDRLPRLRRSPQGQSVAAGGTGILEAETEDAGPFDFEWFFNGVGIEAGTAAPGQRDLALVVPNVQDANLGLYWVVVSRNGRSVESERASLEIGDDPGRVTARKYDDLPPTGGGSGGSVGFSSVSAGRTYSQTVNNFGATSQDCSVFFGIIGGAKRWLHLRPECSGTMQIETCGSSISSDLYFYRGNPCEGRPFTLVSTGLQNLDCLGTAPLSGAVRSRNLFAVGGGETYHVAVDTRDGDPGLLRINWKLAAQPLLTLGIPPYTPGTTYQWRLAGTNIAGASANNLILPDFGLPGAGTYALVSSTPGGIITNRAVVIPQAGSVPLILCDTNVNVTLSGPGSEGSNPTYQWRLNGTKVAGTNLTHVVNVHKGTTGNYSLVTSNASLSVTSSIAAIFAPPELIAPMRTGLPFDLTLVGWPGSNYVLQANPYAAPYVAGTNIVVLGEVTNRTLIYTNPAWISVVTNQIDASGLFFRQESVRGGQNRFFRIRP